MEQSCAEIHVSTFIRKRRGTPMSKILYYDCFAGISGDMNLGAMIDLGVPAEHLRSELLKLGLDGYHLDISPDQRKGISGTRVDVVLYDHQHHHGKVEGHADHQEHNHNHRNLDDIVQIIRHSALSERVKDKSIRVFSALAEAEGKVHGIPVDRIHFHEVGAIDAIIDIVGAAICAEYLDVDRIVSSPVELGGGFVTCAHGTFPVPAPATAELLAGIHVKTGAVQSEATTPTGAAIIATFADSFSEKISFTVRKTGYGLGRRDTEIPNVLRVFLGEETADTINNGDTCWIIETNIDDMNPEFHGYLMERLFNAGADDVYFAPIIMKKGRPAVRVSFMCDDTHRNALSDILIRESTTFGFRITRAEKTSLERKETSFLSSIGEIRIKIAIKDGVPLKWKAEYDDCAAIAREKNIPIRDVYDIVRREFTI
jgi:uncharacterized protein (TIGR00299 family) protein